MGSSACKTTRGQIPLGPDQGEGWGGFVQWVVLTRTVRDSAAVTDLMAGPMPGDPYAAPPLARPLLAEVGANPGKLRIGFFTGSLYGRETHPENVAAVQEAVKHLTHLGHHVVPANRESTGTGW